MPLTNFPKGVSSFGVPLIGSGPIMSAGNVFWVDSNAGRAAGATGDFDQPFPTIAAAIASSLVKTNHDDVIMVKARHSESVTAAGTITLSKAGVRLYGLGSGRQRPTINFTTATTAELLITADSVSMENFVFSAITFDAIVRLVKISGADARIANCEFVMGDSGEQSTQAIVFDTGAARAVIQQNVFRAPAAGAGAAMGGGVALDGIVIADNVFEGDFSTACVNNTVAAWTNVRLLRNTYYGSNASEPIAEFFTGATGIAAYNLSYVSTMAAGGSIVGDAIAKFENYITDTAANSGILDPTGVTL